MVYGNVHVKMNHLCIDYDSSLMVKFVIHGVRAGCSFRSMVDTIHWWLLKDWHVGIDHEYREHNNVADFLVNVAHVYSVDLHILRDPSRGYFFVSCWKCYGSPYDS